MKTDLWIQTMEWWLPQGMGDGRRVNWVKEAHIYGNGRKLDFRW